MASCPEGDSVIEDGGEMGSQVPAGWYDDPAGSGGQRYWDGARWSEQLRPPAANASPSGPGVVQGAGSSTRPDRAVQGGRPRWGLVASGAGLLVLAVAAAAVVLTGVLGDGGAEERASAARQTSDPGTAAEGGDDPTSDPDTGEPADEPTDNVSEEPADEPTGNVSEEPADEPTGNVSQEGADDGTAADDVADDGATGSGAVEAAATLDLVVEGTLTVCSEVPYEPFEFEDPDAPSGYSRFDIDLMQEIADRNDLDLVVVNTDFAGLTSGAEVAAGACDVAASAITITEERAAIVDFTEPYYSTDEGEDYGFLVVQGREDGLVSLLDDTLGAIRADGVYDQLFTRYFSEN